MKSSVSSGDGHFRPSEPTEVLRAVSALEELIETGGAEGKIQKFLQKHAYFLLLCPIYDHLLVIAQAPLGSEYCADFTMYGSCNGPWWTFVELEKCEHRLFNKAGDPSSQLVHAQRQTRDWRRWIDNNRAYFEAHYGDHMRGRGSIINTVIIIGRRRDLSARDREQLLQMNNENSHNLVMTYDGLLERARAMCKLKAGTPLLCEAFTYAEFARLREEEGGIYRFAHRAQLELWSVESEIDDYRF